MNTEFYLLGNDLSRESLNSHALCKFSTWYSTRFQDAVVRYNTWQNSHRNTDYKIS